MSAKTSVVVSFPPDNLIMQLDSAPGVLFWTCGLAIDADGSPQAYSPSGSPPGLDYLANAGSPGNWWGIACNSAGVPYIQKPDDPFPGFYVSTTALEDSSKDKANPARYVDSGKTPFIVLPSKPKFDPLQALGDLAVVFNNNTGQSSWAVYADIGPANKIGEGSMALAIALGLNPSPKSGGTEKETIAMIYWPGSKLVWPATADELSTQAWFLFQQWGGFASAKVAMPQFNWDQFTMPVPVPPTPMPIPPVPPPPSPPKPTEDLLVTIICPPGVQIVVQKSP